MDRAPTKKGKKRRAMKMSVDLPPLAGVGLELVEEGVEQGDHQVDQRHHEGNQERLGLLEQRAAHGVRRSLGR
ncbi:hypothetical protein EYF80_059191 [Liparis tanakae]|uniref:Uncharacterized protein n=1 Tax=Liparis tanakae TaxID=230148 RepID=A0A4Z2ENY9_9TELE|nr:hypothetical protein EYF80_059191 [Liparis tanakae]